MILTDAGRKFLEELRYAVVATINKDGTPQQTIVWYILEDDQIIMNTAKGRLKELNLRRDARLSFCVEEGYRYVTIRGKATLHVAEAQRDIEALAARYVGAEKAREMVRIQFSKEDRMTVRMSIDKVAEYGFGNFGY